MTGHLNYHQHPKDNAPCTEGSYPSTGTGYEDDTCLGNRLQKAVAHPFYPRKPTRVLPMSDTGCPVPVIKTIKTDVPCRICSPDAAQRNDLRDGHDSRDCFQDLKASWPSRHYRPSTARLPSVTNSHYQGNKAMCRVGEQAAIGSVPYAPQGIQDFKSTVHNYTWIPTGTFPVSSR